MRLINTNSGCFEEFIGSSVPEYAILSHTWEDEEVSFEAMRTSTLACQSMKGHQKIAMACRLASQAGISYAWVDTCCIDKSSSAELTEAINSMYRWYQRATVCYAFLSDLEPAVPGQDLSVATMATLRNCRWFTRGWTLQELIAPRHVVFYDRDWQMRGSKIELAGILSELTNIEVRILQHAKPLSTISTAQKMSWAAERETTRIEDTAYCLLGIFDVNMPLLYGEEEGAFRRLQEEIIKSATDYSIFAWRWQTPTREMAPGDRRIFSGVLARSPRDFLTSRDLAKQSEHEQRDISTSNHMVRVQSPLIFWARYRYKGTRYVLPIDCSWDPKIHLGILLRNCGPDQFVRDDPWTFVEYSRRMPNSRPRTRYIFTDLPEPHEISEGCLADMKSFIAKRRSRVLSLEIDMQSGFAPLENWPVTRWDEEDYVWFMTGDSLRDSVSQRVHAPFGVTVGERHYNIQPDLMIYILGWSSLELEDLMCTVMDYKIHINELKEVQSQLFSWDPIRPYTRLRLKQHKIPQASAAVFKVPGEEVALVYYFEVELIYNLDVCLERYWKVKLKCKVYPVSKVPPITYGTWGQD